MLTILFLFLFACALVGMIRLAGWAPALAGFFILFGFVGRAVSIGYIDLFGPHVSHQLQMEVGGSGSAAPALILSFLCFIIPLALLFRSGIRTSETRPYKIWLNDAGFVVLLIYVAVLYIDLFDRGVIPLFAGLERFEYTELHAGFFHKVLFEFLYLFSFCLGYLLVRPRLSGRPYDLRILVVLVLLGLYFLLTGHRFSAFFNVASFLGLGFAAVWARARGGTLPDVTGEAAHGRSLIAARSILPALVVTAVLAIGFALYNSMVNVRGYEDPSEAFVQRALIQPAELWWVTWDSSVREGRIDGSLAWSLMFDEPLDPTRNTGIQYLMVKALGDERARDLLFMGEQFAGGYPEVIFELFGPLLAWPILIVYGFGTALLIRMVVWSVSQGIFMTSVLAVWVYFGFSLLYIGGMLNFIVTPTFWLKMATLMIVGTVEVLLLPSLVRQVRAARRARQVTA
ncbi:DUF6418 domain-containing protein [Thermaurantiacus sp.]